MDSTHYQRLLDSDISRTSSWAIWYEKRGKHNEKVLETITECHLELNPKIIVVGYNPNGEEKPENSDPWHNFHSKYRGCRDVWMKEAFNSGIFRGAFLTDLFPTVKNARISDIDPNTVEHKPALDRLDKIIDALGCRRPYVIPLGDNAKRILSNYKQMRHKIVLDDGIPHFAKSTKAPQKPKWLAEVEGAKSRYQSRLL